MTQPLTREVAEVWFLDARPKVPGIFIASTVSPY